MTYLQSVASARPDSPKCTFSGWFYIPAVVYAGMVSQSGTPFGPYCFGSGDSRLRLQVLDSGGLKWRFEFLCVEATVRQGRCFSDFLPISTILPDTWNHIGNSVRTDGDNYSNRCHLYLNRQSVNEQNPGAGQVIQPQPSIGVFSDWINNNGFFGWGPNYDQAIHDGVAAQMESFNMEVSGFEYRLPGERTANPNVMLSECVFWFDKYLDLSSTSNLNMFITPEGKPANLSLAIDTLGTPTYSNRRDGASGIKFQDNTGDGGSMNVIGTDPQDFFPGP